MTTENRNSASGSAGAESSERMIRAILMPGDGAEQSSFDVQAIFKFARKYWVAIFCSGLLGGIAAFAISFAFPKVYRAEVLLAPSNSNGDSGGGIQGLIGKYSALASAVGVGVPSQEGLTPVAIARLQSRGFIEGFIADEKIMDTLYPDEHPETASTYINVNRSVHTLQDGYQRFVRSIMLVEYDKIAGLVTVRIDWTDRKIAAVWANELVNRLNSVMRADAMEETERSLKYLQVQLEKADYVTLKDSISSVMEAQINKRMLATTEPDYAFRILDPAKASDENKKEGPKRSIFLVLGLVLGSLFGVLLSLHRRAKTKSSPTEMSPH